jgi:hypothetical protein
MASCENTKLMKLKVAEVTNWWNDKLMKLEVDEMASCLSWQNIKFIKWQVA